MASRCNWPHKEDAERVLRDYGSAYLPPSLSEEGLLGGGGAVGGGVNLTSRTPSSVMIITPL